MFTLRVHARLGLLKLGHAEIVRIETSQKAQRGVHLGDLAAYIDKRRAAAIKECRQLTGTTWVRLRADKPKRERPERQ
jgi:hypothetical protein